MNLPFDTDLGLLRDIALGDTRAFEVLYRRYFAKLYGTAYKRLQDKALAEEVVQELFVSLWERRQSLAIKDVSAYLFSSIKYLIIANIKKNNLLESLNTTDIDLAVDNTREYLSFDELHQSYQQALKNIPYRCREVFLLKRSGLSHKEISEKLDISEKTVENQMTKALKILKEALKEYTILLLVLSVL
jgi:RNA polymerase sigma-70 factor (family 1)